MRLEDILSSGAPELGTPLDEEKLNKFRAYYELLTKRNAEFNLTAIKGEEDAARLHFLDSIGILGAWDFDGARVIDVGTGAGFPGMAIKIAAPNMSMTLLDSTDKKVQFLKEVSVSLGVRVNCLHGRAEELGQNPKYREGYDIAVSRAVARLNLLAELCLPLVKEGGTFIAMKSLDSDEEISEAEIAIEALGGSIADVFEYQIPETDVIRRAVVIAKEEPTPARYPRRFAKIQASPLK